MLSALIEIVELYFVAMNGRLDCATLLLTYKSDSTLDINSKDSCGSTPLMDLLRKGNTTPNMMSCIGKVT